MTAAAAAAASASPPSSRRASGTRFRFSFPPPELNRYGAAEASALRAARVAKPYTTMASAHTRPSVA